VVQRASPLRGEPQVRSPVVRRKAVQSSGNLFWLHSLRRARFKNGDMHQRSALTNRPARLGSRPNGRNYWCELRSTRGNGAITSRMMNSADPKKAPILTTNRRRRWWRAQPTRAKTCSPVRRRLRRIVLILFAAIGAGVPLYFWLAEPPKIEPPFERLADVASGPVKEFALTDIHGTVHDRAEWTDRKGVVLFLVATECPVTRAYAEEMERLARFYAPRGIPFYAVESEPGITVDSASRHAERSGWSFPVLLDPELRVARQVGATVTPEAVVLASDGQVVYHGRIDDRNGAGRVRRTSPHAHELESALQAVVADELPTVSYAPSVGTPLVDRMASSNANEPITFSKHVAPVLWNNCARCHRPGAVGPFSLLTYKDAAKRAEFIRDVVLSGQMPPWKPRAGAGVFRDAPRLSPLEKEILTAWAETGRAEGNPADLPPVPTFNDDWQLGKPDAVVTMPESFQVPAADGDIYWAFPLPVNAGKDMVINALEFRPGNRRVVHHSRIYLDETGDARRRDKDQPGPGFPGWVHAPGSMELPYPSLGGWTPGMTPRFAPEGVGRRIKDGSEIVVRVHYHPTGKPEEDRSSIGLYSIKQPVTRSMAGYTLCSHRLDIPPGEKRHRVIISSWIKADIHLYTVVPHAHYLAREFRVAATLPDGTIQPLLWITDWDLDWQDQYRYQKPVRLPKGTLLTLAVYFDNSDGNPRNPHKPPRRVHFGIATDDEMCACHFEFLPDQPAGYAAYPQKSPFGL
jgi:thiol-disulfide isomerase/thioredoxin